MDYFGWGSSAVSSRSNVRQHFNSYATGAKEKLTCTFELWQRSKRVAPAVDGRPAGVPNRRPSPNFAVSARNIGVETAVVFLQYRLDAIADASSDPGRLRAARSWRGVEAERAIVRSLRLGGRRRRAGGLPATGKRHAAVGAARDLTDLLPGLSPDVSPSRGPWRRSSGRTCASLARRSRGGSLPT